MSVSTAPPTWFLHPQLDRDAITTGALPLCRVLLINNANFPWLILVPRRSGVVEIIDLNEADQLQLMREIAQTSRALRTLTHCDKLNIAALGNVVPQLHIHVIARFHNDAAGPQPVWGHVAQREPKAYSASDRERLLSELRSAMALPSQA